MATNINVGSAYLTIIPSARGFIKALRRELSKEGFDKYGQDLGKEIEKGWNRSRVTTKIKRSFTNLFSGITSLGKAGVLDTLIASALAAVSALAPVSGLLVGVPAVALAAAGALGALMLALKGVGTVLGSSLLGDSEGFEEGLKGLTPSAGKVVGELGSIFHGLNDLIQEAFFAPMVRSAKGLGEELKGPVREGLSAIAGSLGTVVAGVLAWAKGAEGASTLAQVTAETAKFIEGAGAGLPQLLQGIFDLASLVADDLGASIGETFGRFGDWLSQIASDGRAQAWFDQAIDVSKQLLSVVVNLGRFIAAVFNAAGTDGGTLAVLIELSEKMADWAESSQGQAMLNNLFLFFGAILTEVARAIGVLVTGFAGIATWFNSLSPQTQGQIAQFLAWSIVIGPLVGRIAALVMVVRGLYTAVSLLIVGIVKAIGTLARWIAVASVAVARAVMWGVTMTITFVRVAAVVVAAGARMMVMYIRLAAAAVASAIRTAVAWTVTATLQ
nr:hypothetical protein GCM10025732_48340 [Glycomyces mayteni]